MKSSVTRPLASKPEQSASPWPHRVAWMLAIGVFPLIWMGGLVTTYDAGMAVPDWPNTYGYNLFLYPLASWLHVWDVFLEHSHRLIASAVGLTAIALAVLLWRQDRRRGMRWMGVAAVVGVLIQGTLGGLRVIGDKVLLADVHGCVAPLYFAFCVSLVIFTSRRWGERSTGPARSPTGLLPGLASITTALVWVQIALGAQLRHVPRGLTSDWLPGSFTLWVWLHVLTALLLMVVIAWLLVVAIRQSRQDRFLARRAWLLAGLFELQLLLGVATWVTNYGWPLWFSQYVWDLGYTVVAAGPLQAVTTTAHVAVGSLTLAAALVVAIWSRRPRADKVRG